MKHILIIQTRPGIGDLCIFLSSMHQIAKKHPNSKITLITKKTTIYNEIIFNKFAKLKVGFRV